MKRYLLQAALLAALLGSSAIGCGEEDRAPSATKTPTPTPTPTAVPTATPTPVVRSARLDLDIRWSADVRLSLVGSRVEASLVLNDAREVAVAGVELRGQGAVHAYPEVAGTLYSAKFAAPAYPGGRCGEQPATLALTLFRRGGNLRVAGGVAVYCGSDKDSGTPARVLRLSGNLPVG